MDQDATSGSGVEQSPSEQEGYKRWRKRSFFLHLRPSGYQSAAVDYRNTWYLGFFCMFFLVLECVTGVLLMVYYGPSPAEAYQSIIKLQTEVPFGSLMRDLHRLGGELMIVAVLLHMLRVYVSGSHNGKRALTWATGIGLLVLTLLLAFSGYLLPWDQLAYWAVTIGTSMAQTVPYIGDRLLVVLRGGPEFGFDGLLRFYLLHIIVLPVALFGFLAVHYYRVARVHGISLPAKEQNFTKNNTGRRLFFPDIFLMELGLSLLALTILCLVVTFFYDAPLEHHADPLHTPAHTRAPWFFLWLQGALKLGDSFVMGICLPLGLLLFLLLLPFIDRGKRRLFSRRPFAIIGTLVLLVSISWLTILGRPSYGVGSGPAAEVLQVLAPDEGESSLCSIDFDDLKQGIYETKVKNYSVPVALSDWLNRFAAMVEGLEGTNGMERVKGVVVLQQWQVNLKRVVFRIAWLDLDNNEAEKSLEKVIYISRHRSQEIGED